MICFWAWQVCNEAWSCCRYHQHFGNRFPRQINDLDLVAHKVLEADVDLVAEHPGFKDEAYRRRRKGELGDDPDVVHG